MLSLITSGMNFNIIDTKDPEVHNNLVSQNNNNYMSENVPKEYQINFIVEFSEDKLTVEKFGDYDIFELPDCELSFTTGAPAVPVKLISVILPVNVHLNPSDISVEILDEQIINGKYNLVPAQDPRPVSEYLPGATDKELDEQLNGFEMENEIYYSYNFYPSHIIEPLTENEIGNICLGSLQIFPIRYWPMEQTVILFKKVSVTIVLHEVKTAQISNDLSDYQIEMIRNIIQNKNDFELFYTTSPITPPGSPAETRSGDLGRTGSKLDTADVQYVIITNSSNYYSDFYKLAEWKTKKGVPARIIDDGWIKSKYTGNDTQEKIRNFIIDAKTTWNTKWVLLGGDISVIPYRKAYGYCGGVADATIPTDLYYSDLDGNWDADSDKIYGETSDNINLYPDIYVGRAPVESSAEVKNFVSKTLNYERNASYGFQLEMLFMAEKLDSNTDAAISKDYIGTTFVPSRFNITTLYQTLNNLSTTTALKEMSRGKGIINHAGHCNYYVMSIGNSKLYRPDVDTLTNKDEQGILYTIGCITTAFENNDCIAEHFVKNTKGGTVAFVGNSRYGWYTPNNPKAGPSNYYDQEFFNQLLVKEVYHIGETFGQHKIKYVTWSKSDGAYRWCQYCLNLLGDPELPLWTDLPMNLKVQHVDEVYFGPQTVSVQVNDSKNNTPLSNAMVCLQGTDVYAYGLTDANGVVNFYIDPNKNQPINVTVTKFNYQPYEGKIDKIIPDSKPPAIAIGQDVYGWYNEDPGNAIDVDFDSLGETDLSKAEYSLTPAGPWYTIFNTPRPVFTKPWNISAIWSSLKQGYNNVFIKCFDNAKPKHWVMGNITVKKDTESPTIAINKASYGWYTTDPGAIIDVDFSNISKGSLNGIHSPLAKAEYSINSPLGPWLIIFQGQYGNYNLNWPLNWFKLVDGTNTIYIRLFDEAGNEDNTTDNIYFDRDTLPPKVVVRKSVYGWYSSDPGSVIDIDFTNGGNGSKLDYAQYKIEESGVWKSIFTDDTANFINNWQLNWAELSEGINNIYVRCFDCVGFEDVTNDKFQIMKDTHAPKIKINRQIYGWYRKDPGNVIDIDFINDGTHYSLLDYARYKVYPPSSGGSSTKPWRIIFSNDVSNYTNDWSVLWSDLADGNNNLEIQVYDLASNINVSIDTVYFLKDTTPPNIIVNTQSYGWYSTDPGKVIDVDFSNTGTGSDLLKAEYRVNKGAWIKVTDINLPNYDLNWSVDWNKLVEGENNIEVRLWDIAGFSTTKNLTFFKDITKPEMKINKNVYGWYNSDPGNIINVDFLSKKSGSGSSTTLYSMLDYAEYRVGLDSNWITIFDQNCNEYITDWKVNWTLLTEGQNRIYLRARDIAGNLNETVKTIIIKKDTEQPTLKINQQEYGWYSKPIDMGTNIDVDFYHVPASAKQGKESNDQYSNLTKAQYMVSGTGVWLDIFNINTESYTSNWNLSWEHLGQGENIIFFRIYDLAGNVHYDPAENISVYKDIQPPSVIINEAEYGWYNVDPGNIIDVDFSAGDSSMNSPLKLAQYKFGVYGDWIDIFNFTGTVKYDFQEPWGVIWSKVNEGKNSIFIRVLDISGNVNSYVEEIIINRDTIGPEPPVLVSPVNNGQTVENRPIHYWLEPNDPGSGSIGNYHIQVSLDEDFMSTITDTSSAKLVYSHSIELENNLYYWRVRAIDSVGNIGAWSSAWNFKIISIKDPGANMPPIANAGDDIVVYINEAVTFNGTGSYDPENDELTFLWDINDDQEVDKVGKTITWKYSINGTYLVTLEVFDSHGGSDSDSLIVTVLDIDRDSDDDGMSDDWEIFYGLDPHNPKDAMEDSDNDGYLNNMEFVQGSAPTNSFSTPITSNDRTFPKITHTRVEEGLQFNAIKIIATVVDEDSGVKEVNLHYKKKNDPYYNSISMGTENIYSATIPASIVTLDDVEYYIEAIDNSKHGNVVYFGKYGHTLERPTQNSDIDIDVREKIMSVEEPDMVEDFKQMFDFESLEICFIVFILFIILLAIFGVSLSRAVHAKQLAEVHEQRKTIQVAHGKNMIWEGYELEKISEDEDMILINDDSRLDEI